MASPKPLTGAELIDCARANNTQGIEIAAQRCGYGEDFATFELELQKAGEHIGTKINSFADLIQAPKDRRNTGVTFAPDSPTQL